jgi:hypothetical protein
MRTITLGLALAALAAGLPGSTAHAQQDTTISVPTTITRANYSLRVGAGPTFTDSDFFGTGWHLGGALRGRPQGWPVGLQLGLFYHELGEGDIDDPDVADLVDSNFLQVTLDAVVDLSTVSESFDPYILGGVGLYDGDFGLNAGVGADFAFTNLPLALFLEFRIHRVFTEGDDLSMFPLTAGVRFRL